MFAAEIGFDHRLPSQRRGSGASLSLAEANHFLRSARRFLKFRLFLNAMNGRLLSKNVGHLSLPATMFKTRAKI
jgi:hypothetical protein